MNLRQAAEMALDSLDTFRALGTHWESPDEKAYQALRAALAEADEPVAWRVRASGATGTPGPWRIYQQSAKPGVNHPECCDFAPLYTHPPRREQLTEEAIEAVADKGIYNPRDSVARLFIRFAREIERAHGIGRLPPVAEQPTAGGLGGDE